MGLAAELKGDLGAAARGYWAALGLTSVTFGSRLQREQIREAAYAGLTRLAMRRNQPEWGALLAVCANMAHTYTTSDQAAKQHAEFYDVLEATCARSGGPRTGGGRTRATITRESWPASAPRRRLPRAPRATSARAP